MWFGLEVGYCWQRRRELVDWICPLNVQQHPYILNHTLQRVVSQRQLTSIFKQYPNNITSLPTYKHSNASIFLLTNCSEDYLSVAYDGEFFRYQVSRPLILNHRFFSIKVQQNQNYLNCNRINSLFLYLISNQMDQQSLLDSESPNSIISTEETEPTSPRKGFLKRAFGPIQPGAMRGSIFALLASAMGTGMFNLPYRINQIGIAAYILFVIAAGIFSYLGMYLISQLILKFKVESYSAMSDQALGRRFRKVAQFCILIYSWGITVCYQVIFGKFILQLLADTFDLPLYNGDLGRQNQQYSTTGQWMHFGVTVGGILLNLIFILKKEIGILQKIAIIGVISVVINVLIITVTLFTGFQVEVEDKESGIKLEYFYRGITGIPWGDLKWFALDSWSDFSQQLQGLASLIFCYVNHQLVFPLVFDLNNPSKRRIIKVFNRVHITEMISYIVVGMAGYLLLAEHSANRPINAIVMASIQTIPVSLGKLLMVFSLFFAVPLNLFPARDIIYTSFELEKSNKNHLIISLSLAFSGALIAILFQKVNSYFGLLGGTAGVMMAGLIPTICFYKLIGLHSWKQKLMGAFMGLISLLCMAGALLSVIVPS